MRKMGIDWEEILDCEGENMQDAYDDMIPSCDSYDDLPFEEYEGMDEDEMMTLSELVERFEEPWLKEEMVRQELRDAGMLADVVISIDHDKIKQLQKLTKEERKRSSLPGEIIFDAIENEENLRCFGMEHYEYLYNRMNKIKERYEMDTIAISKRMKKRILEFLKIDSIDNYNEELEAMLDKALVDAETKKRDNDTISFEYEDELPFN